MEAVGNTSPRDPGKIQGVKNQEPVSKARDTRRRRWTRARHPERAGGLSLVDASMARSAERLRGIEPEEKQETTWR